MRRYLLAAGIAAAALIPTLALAQQTCEQQHDNRVAGTVVGAGVGALIGSAVAGHGNQGAGAIVGGLGGAVVGNQLARPRADCAHAYGYYDRDNVWHPNAVSRSDARGYYDRNGAWVDGAPNGYYNGDGRWVTSQATGRYDRDGRWMPPSANTTTYGPNPAYEVRSNWRNAPMDIRDREDWLERRIHMQLNNGMISQDQAYRALRPLNAVRRQEMSMRHYRGQLSPGDTAYIEAKLDRINDSISVDRGEDRRRD